MLSRLAITSARKASSSASIHALLPPIWATTTSSCSPCCLSRSTPDGSRMRANVRHLSTLADDRESATFAESTDHTTREAPYQKTSGVPKSFDLETQFTDCDIILANIPSQLTDDQVIALFAYLPSPIILSASSIHDRNPEWLAVRLQSPEQCEQVAKVLHRSHIYGITMSCRLATSPVTSALGPFFAWRSVLKSEHAGTDALLKATFEDFPVKTEEAISDLLQHNALAFDRISKNEETNAVDVWAKADVVEEIVKLDGAFIANQIIHVSSPQFDKLLHPLAEEEHRLARRAASRSPDASDPSVESAADRKKRRKREQQQRRHT